MILAYLDETGQESNSYVVIAGHVGHESLWPDFVTAWMQALGPQRKRLHIKDLRFSKERDKELLARLGPIPTRCGLKRLIGGARVSDYEDLIPDPLRKLMGGYIAALFVSVLNLLLSLPEDERVELVFEQQDRFETYARIALSAIANLPVPRTKGKDGSSKLAKWRFVPKDRTIQLDQADYLCYAQLQRLRNPSSKKAQWCSPIIDATGETIGGMLSRDNVRKAVIDGARRYLLFEVNPNVQI